VSLTTQTTLRSDLARDTSDLVGEDAQRARHTVDGVLQFEYLAAHVDGDLLRQVAASDGLGHLCDRVNLIGEIRGHQVHAVRQELPGKNMLARREQLLIRNHAATPGTIACPPNFPSVPTS
jgi:hypothetical protein